MAKLGRMAKKYRYIVLILLGVGLYFAFKKGPQPITMDEVHTTGIHTIKDSIQAVGEVKLLNEQNLTFTVGGVIDRVFVKIGDQVKAGKALAEISSAKQRNQIAQAQKNYEMSMNRLNQIQGGGKESLLLQLQNDIQQNQLKLSELEQQIPLSQVQISNNISKNDDQIEEIKKQVILLESKQVTIKNELEEIKLRQGDDGEKTIETNRTAVNIVRDDIKSISLRLQDYVSSFDTIYGVSNTKISERDRSYFGVRNTALVSDGYRSTQQLLKIADTLTSSNGVTASTGDITILVTESDELIQAIQKIQLLASNTQDLLKNRSLEAGDFTASRSQGYQNQMDQVLSWSSNSILSMQNNKKALLTMESEQLTDLKNTNTLGNKELELEENQKQLATQQATLNQLVLANQQLGLEKTFQTTQQTNNQQTLSSQIQLLQAQVNEQKNFNGGTKYDLAQARQELELQRLQIEQAQLSLKDYQLIAYEDGTIIDFDFRVGENLAVSAKNNYMTIGTPDQYQIELMLDQVDVIRLKEGMVATIELNAITDIIFTGTVTKISTVPVKENNVNSYKVTVAFENNDRKLVSGMIGTVTIDIQTKPNVLAVPLTAVVYSGNESMVTLYQSGDTLDTVKLHPIKVGISDILWIEVIDGLTSGQQILTIGKNISGPVVPGFGPPPEEVRSAGE